MARELEHDEAAHGDPQLSAITAAGLGVVASVVYGPVEGFAVGAMVGSPGPIALSFTLVVHVAARRRSSSTAERGAAVDNLLPG